jgi:NitT/TauT family transport system substrate-binding protein
LRKALLISIILALTLVHVSPTWGWDWNIFGNLLGGKPDEQEVVSALSLRYVPTVHSIDPVVLDKLYAPNFKNLKFELIKFGSWDDLLDALRSGTIQGASLPAALDLLAAEGGVPLQIVAKSHRHGNALIAANDVKSIGDLLGQKVAVPELASTHTILLYRALGNKTNLGGIRLAEIDPQEMAAALSRGDIRAYVADQYIGAENVLAGKAKWLRRSQDVWRNETCCVLALNRDFIAKNPQAVQELVDGQYDVVLIDSHMNSNGISLSTGTEWLPASQLNYQPSKNSLVILSGCESFAGYPTQKSDLAVALNSAYLSGGFTEISNTGWDHDYLSYFFDSLSAGYPASYANAYANNLATGKWGSGQYLIPLVFYPTNWQHDFKL